MTPRPFIRTAALAIAASLAACANTATAPSPAPDVAAESAEIDQLRADFMGAMATQDFAALAALTHPDFQQVIPGGPAHLQMLAAAGEAPLPPGYRIDITPKELVIINEDWAYEYGTSVQSYQPDGAPARVEIPNTYLLILRKHEGKWTPYREVASALPPPGSWE